MSSFFSKLKYLISGVIIGGVLIGGVSFAAQDYVLSLFDAKLVFNGTEKVGSDKPNQYFNGQTYVPTSLIYNGTTYVPLRFFSESIGQPVKYESNSKTIYVGQVPDNGKIQRCMSDIMEPYYKSSSSFSVNNKMKVAGKEYIKGYSISSWATKPFTASFNLEGKYESITGIAGLEDDYNKDNMTVEFYGDDKLLTSLTLNAGKLPENLVLSVKGVIKLDIKVLGGYNSNVDLVDLQIK